MTVSAKFEATWDWADVEVVEGSVTATQTNSGDEGVADVGRMPNTGTDPDAKVPLETISLVEHPAAVFAMPNPMARA